MFWTATAISPALLMYSLTMDQIRSALCWTGEISRRLNSVSSVKIGVGRYSKEFLVNRLWMLYYVMVFSEKPYYQKTASDIYKAILELECDNTTGKLRKQPFCIMLYGEPGVGKSSSAVRIAQACMHKMYGTFNDYDMVAINETDKFQSEYRTFHKVVLFDDIDASCPEASDSINPFHKMIDYVNNIEKTALNPNVDMKGKVYMRPDLVILTTNRKCDGVGSLGAGFVRSKGALARRTNYAIHLHTGFYRCSIKTCHSLTTELADTYGDQVEYRPLSRYQNIDREVMYDFISDEFMKHHKEQEEFIASMNMNFDNLNKNLKLEVVAEDEVLDSQAGLSNLLSDERVLQGPSIEAKKKYYAERVDWDFFIAHINNYSGYGLRYVLAPDGRVLPECRQSNELSHTLEFYVQVLNEYILSELNLECVFSSEHYDWRFIKLETPSNDNLSESEPDKVSSDKDNSESINSNFDPSEEVQIDTALTCFNKVNQHPIRILKHVVHGPFEIDLVVEFEEIVFVVECKRSYLGAHSSRQANIKQVKRSSALVHYYCKKRVFGLIYDFFGFRLVCDFGCTGQEMVPFVGFFQRVLWAQHICDIPYKVKCTESLLNSIHKEPPVDEFITEENEVISDLIIHYSNM